MVNEFGNPPPKCPTTSLLNQENNFEENDGSLSSESDALIIDETIRRKITTTTNKKPSRKKPTSKLGTEIIATTKPTAENPFFNASLFELTQTHENRRKKPSNRQKNTVLNTCSLQPNIQFKCPRCHLNGFETLPSLQQHFQTCSQTDGATSNINTKSSTSAIYPANSTAASFKLTRKVFLCSACGTYYENWNLYVHMREYHRRFICLYCLGMFRHIDDLCEHIQGRHHQRAGHRTTPPEFYQVYREPCYVICCQCQRQFSSETDDAFFYHQCHTNVPKNNCQIEMTAASSVISPPASPEESVATVPAVVAPSIVQESDFNEEMDAPSVGELVVDTRKVPKLSLKLPKFVSKKEEEEEEEEFDEEDEEEEEEDKMAEIGEKEELVEKEEKEEEQTVELSVAGMEVALKKLELDRPLDKIPIRELLQHCLNATIDSCIYCNHARRIAVNGRQLAVHAISEHRYTAVNKSITEEELSPESFNSCLRAGFDELSMSFFNLLELSTTKRELVEKRPLFECFQCYFTTHAHKELYLHNRKYHSKSSLLCIMCKTNFYTYSELVSHLCPGNYDPSQNGALDLRFRCALCPLIGDVDNKIEVELPSAFRLMCHLRKRHATCDVCLEDCHTQMALSNHVWKHKLHHFCYRCAIAYRNKPDITRHLFWKHGTESVTCQKCLQKKWSHVYHFCVPPSVFECDICHGTQVHTAQALRVHKRLHTEEFKHPCQFDGGDDANFSCQESFISRKLMLKHVQRCHVEQNVEEIEEEEEEENLVVDKMVEEPSTEKGKEELKTEEIEEIPDKVAPSAAVVVKVDVLDLPELNLSEESSSSDSGDDEKTKRTTTPVKMAEIEQERHLEEKNDEIIENPLDNVVEGASTTTSVINMNDIWENFKNYQQEKNQKLQFPTTAPPVVETSTVVFDIPIPVVEVVQMNNDNDDDTTMTTDLVPPVNYSWALTDHDYCKPDELLVSTTVNADKMVEMQFQLETELVQNSSTESAPSEERCDHDYCSPRGGGGGGGQTVKSDIVDKVSNPTKKTNNNNNSSSSNSSNSSSSSSSSCECGSSCSCSDSSETSTATAVSTSSQNGSSDSSTAEGRKRQLEARVRKRKMRGKALKLEKKQKKQQQQQFDNTAIDLLKNQETNDNTAEKVAKKMPSKNNKIVTVTTTTTTKNKCQIIINESDLETSETETDEEFYDREPQKMALLLRQQQEKEEKSRVAHLLQSTNDNKVDDIDSRPLTPPPEEVFTASRSSGGKKKKNKKKKKKRRQHRNNFDMDIDRNCQSTATIAADDIIDVVNVKNNVILSQLPNVIVPPPPPSIPYYQQFHQQTAAVVIPHQFDSSSQNLQTTSDSSVNNLTSGDTSSLSLVRSSKRRRVPNKFYGYSSGDELSNEQRQQRQTPAVKRHKMSMMAATDSSSSRILSPKLVPPITIRHHHHHHHHHNNNQQQQTVEPITLRLPKNLTAAVTNDSSTSSVQPEAATAPSIAVSSPKVRRRFQPPIPPLRLSTTTTITTTTTLISSSVAATGGNLATPQQQQQQRRRHLLLEPSKSGVADATENSLLKLKLDEKNQMTSSFAHNNLPCADDIEEHRIMTVTRSAQPPQLYCYCRCPYDEVSEMIGCDSSECEIEWFHFECVGIMVPPKGQWYCPDCRKKNLLLTSGNVVASSSSLAHAP